MSDSFMDTSTVPYSAVRDVAEVRLASDDLVSDEVFLIFQWVYYAVVLMIIAIFGIVTNIINIICFVKMGLKDPVNVSLLGLAVSDMGSLVPLIVTSICFNPAFHESDLPFDSMDVQYLVSAWPHLMFIRVSSWMTALITVWRCLCITMPLKVKSIITSKRATIIIVCIFIAFTCSVSPVYYSNRLAMKYFPRRNMTLLGLVYTDDRTVVEQISFAINNVFLPVTAFVTITVCTAVLVGKLREKTKWRLKCTAPMTSDATSERDQKVAKMVVMISVLFIACFIPICCTFIFMIVEPEVSLGGQYKNTLYVLGGLSVLLEATNSSTNIFIYYHMSSRYRKIFRQLCNRGKRQ